ncbi:hypothetical protein QTP86_003779 [Hemibagrus guttatus]|nr:hypothetical protein QTP86_003779 [Hemibagrus guttatus]
MDFTRYLKVCCGIWHQDISSRSYKSLRGITMVRSNELSEAFRKKIVDAYESSKGYKKISKEFVISHSTVQKIIYKWRTLKTSANMARSGRPSKFTPRADRKMLKDVSKTPKITGSTGSFCYSLCQSARIYNQKETTQL